MKAVEFLKIQSSTVANDLGSNTFLGAFDITVIQLNHLIHLRNTQILLSSTLKMGGYKCDL